MQQQQMVLQQQQQQSENQFRQQAAQRQAGLDVFNALRQGFRQPQTGVAVQRSTDPATGQTSTQLVPTTGNLDASRTVEIGGQTLVAPQLHKYTADTPFGRDVLQLKPGEFYEVNDDQRLKMLELEEKFNASERSKAALKERTDNLEVTRASLLQTVASLPVDGDTKIEYANRVYQSFLDDAGDPKGNSLRELSKEFTQVRRDSAKQQHDDKVHAEDQAFQRAQQDRQFAHSDAQAARAAANKPLTAEQVKGQGFGERMAEADKALTRNMPQGWLAKAEQAIAAIPGVNIKVPYLGLTVPVFPALPNTMKSPRQQQYEQGGAEWLAAFLRKESQAQITTDEFDRFGPIFLPQTGDKPEVLAQKALNRQRVTEQFLRSGAQPPTQAGPAYQSTGVEPLAFSGRAAGGIGSVESAVHPPRVDPPKELRRGQYSRY